MSRYHWLHLQEALPLLATLPLPGALGLWARFTAATAALPPGATVLEAVTALGSEFLPDLSAVLQQMDPKSLRRLAMIAAASIDDLEGIVDDPAKEAAALTAVGRMDPLEVVGYALFFLGMRPSAGTLARGSSGSATKEMGKTAQ